MGGGGEIDWEIDFQRVHYSVSSIFARQVIVNNVQCYELWECY